MKVLSLFSGIGAFEKALTNLKIKYELVNYCEIDKYASRAYSLIHNISEDKNLGDITKIDINLLDKDIDLITHGSPCQSFSEAGLEEGGDKDSKTKSSLMWETVNIVNKVRPKIVIWENVRNVLSKNHKHNFDKYLDEMEALGYNNYYELLNACEHGIPQFRIRIFVISILKEFDNGFEFPKPQEKSTNLQEYLEDDVEQIFHYFSEDTETQLKIHRSILPSVAKNFFKERNKILATDRDMLKIRSEKSFTQHNIGINISYCLVTNSFPAVMINKINNIIRRPSGLEYWRLMGFDDDDYYKVAKDVSKTQMYKMAGNSIVVPVIEAIYKNLFKCKVE